MGRVLLAGAAWGALVAAGVQAQAALVLVVAAAVVLFASGRPAARAVRRAHGHSPRFVATHEAGHAVVARKLGASGIWVRTQFDRGAGQMDCRPTGNPVFEVAIDRAGRYAVGSGSGCGGDEALVRAHLRAVPSRDRARVRRDGDRLARRLVSRHGGSIRSAARRIERTGRL